MKCKFSYLKCCQNSEHEYKISRNQPFQSFQALILVISKEACVSKRWLIWRLVDEVFPGLYILDDQETFLEIPTPTSFQGNFEDIRKWCTSFLLLSISNICKILCLAKTFQTLKSKKSLHKQDLTYDRELLFVTFVFACHICKTQHKKSYA